MDSSNSGRRQWSAAEEEVGKESHHTPRFPTSRALKFVLVSFWILTKWEGELDVNPIQPGQLIAFWVPSRERNRDTVHWERATLIPERMICDSLWRRTGTWARSGRADGTNTGKVQCFVVRHLLVPRSRYHKLVQEAFPAGVGQEEGEGGYAWSSSSRLVSLATEVVSYKPNKTKRIMYSIGDRFKKRKTSRSYKTVFPLQPGRRLLEEQ